MEASGKTPAPAPAAPAQAKPAAQQAQVQAPDASAFVEKRTAAEWGEYASSFSTDEVRVNRHAVMGALAGTDPEDTFTREEVKQRLAWLTKPLES